MTSAANRAARTASRNRPSRHHMSQSSGLTSSLASGGDDNSGMVDNGGQQSAAPASAGGGDAAASFMRDVKSQYESLSEKLARENERQSAQGSTATAPLSSSFGSTAAGSGSKHHTGGGASRKVRWAQTAAIASAMDGGDGDSDDDYRRSPLDVLSDLFRKKYTLPIFLLGT
eukprot:CAMPEP_0181123918 /NCGR_PEP_ID=MMETSP1071-20121207/26181_1 /TAXON_ID=35127 /ORGANISM="Thalassiosira sp., Strain NH16" /LENGTH=171 /DNA_ID=CAMNT_0023209143 /DNA_START=224 /DNA_END=736 /DNA_ORIENTATION=-